MTAIVKTPLRSLVINPDQDLAFWTAYLTADALGGTGYFPPAHTAHVVLGLYIAGDTLYIQNPGMVVVGYIQPGYM